MHVIGTQTMITGGASGLGGGTAATWWTWVDKSTLLDPPQSQGEA